MAERSSQLVGAAGVVMRQHDQRCDCPSMPLQPGQLRGVDAERSEQHKRGQQQIRALRHGRRRHH
jgi:hypothetical protein